MGLFGRDEARIARRMYESWARRDLDRAVERVAEGAIWFNTPAMAMIYGPDGAREYMQSWLTAFPGFRLEVVRMVPADGWVAVEYVGRGRQKGALLGPTGFIGPTGGVVEVDFCDVLEIRHGRINACRTYYDMRRLIAQLGLMPARLMAA